jgi:hypothetical protein
MADTCGKCFYFEERGDGTGPDGKPCVTGICFGAPPTATGPGTSNYPVQGAGNRTCALFKPRPKARKS